MPYVVLSSILTFPVYLSTADKSDSSVPALFSHADVLCVDGGDLIYLPYKWLRYIKVA